MRSSCSGEARPGSQRRPPPGAAAGLSTFCGLHANLGGVHERVVRGIADDILAGLERLRGLRAPHLAVQDRILAQAYDISAYKIVADELMRDAGVTLLYHAFGCAAVMRSADEIDALVVETKEGRRAIRGRIFIDDVPHLRRRSREGGRSVGAHPATDGGSGTTRPSLPAEKADRPTAAQSDRMARQSYADQEPRWDGGQRDRRAAAHLRRDRGAPAVPGSLRIHPRQCAGLRERLHRRDRATDRDPRDAPDHRRVSAHRRRYPSVSRLSGYDRGERLARRGAYRRRREICLPAARTARLQSDSVPDHRSAENREPVRRRAVRIDDPRRAVLGTRLRTVLRHGPSRRDGGRSRDAKRRHTAQRRRDRAATTPRVRGRLSRSSLDCSRVRQVTKTRTLRSNLTPGTALWAGRIAQWRALGLSDEDMQKPKIAVVNSSSELAICFSHLDRVAAEVKQAIREAGGMPFEIRTTAPSDFITNAGKHGAYILPSRDLISHDIEVQVEGALLDGMVCLASCDKTTPGQLMAAGRLNIPTIVVICGYQQSGEWNGKHVDIEEVFLKSSYLASGKITLDELCGMANNAVRSPGVCAGMGTANSMHIVCEALGMALPGSAPIAASSPRMLGFARAAGRRVVEMVWEDLKPRQIITEAAIRNAAMTVLALSASINCVKHLQAIAIEAGLDLDMHAIFDEYADRIPLLAAIRPTGEHLIEELDEAG